MLSSGEKTTLCHRITDICKSLLGDERMNHSAEHLIFATQNAQTVIRHTPGTLGILEKEIKGLC